MIHSIVGLMNSGKTLYLTAKALEHYKKGRIIISNYHLNFPHYRIKKDFMIELGKKQPNLKNVAFFLDEFWIWFDSRMSMAGEKAGGGNTLVTYFFNQSSKSDTYIYLTAQHNGQNDKRIRDNLHLLTTCKRVIKVGNSFYPINESKRFLSKKYLDILYIESTEHKRTTVWGITKLVPSKKIYIKASYYFKLYNTSEVIKKYE